MKRPAKGAKAAPAKRPKAPKAALWSIDSPPIPDDLLDRLEPVKARRGRPPAGRTAKVQVTLRLDADTLEAFKAEGPGWQSRIDDTLRRAAGKLKGVR